MISVIKSQYAYYTDNSLDLYQLEQVKTVLDDIIQDDLDFSGYKKFQNEYKQKVNAEQ